MAFCRAINNKSKCPFELGPFIKKDKLDVFSLFLSNHRDLNKVFLTLKRRVEKEQEFNKMWETVSYTDLVKKYGQPKADEIAAKKVALGLYEDDPECPNSKEHRNFWVKGKSTYNDRSKQSESMEATAETTMSDDMAANLLGEGGILSGGALPFAGGNEDAFLKMVNPEAKPAPKKPRKPQGTDPKPAEKVDPEAPLEKARQWLNTIVTESSEVRRFEMSLDGETMTNDLVKGLKTHSAFLEAKYKVMKKLVAAEENRAE
eukprot:15451887-Alexandrium_andersonii.AAC.1